jgi:hypothetical protein
LDFFAQLSESCAQVLSEKIMESFFGYVPLTTEWTFSPFYGNGGKKLSLKQPPGTGSEQWILACANFFQARLFFLFAGFFTTDDYLFIARILFLLPTFSTAILNFDCSFL